MATFTNSGGREFVIEVNTGVARSVKSATGVDLLQLDADDAFGNLVNDIYVLLDVLRLASRPKDAGEQLATAEFEQGMDGDSIETATEALIDAVIDFFPNGRSKILRAAKDKADHQAKALETATASYLESGAVEAELMAQVPEALKPFMPPILG